MWQKCPICNGTGRVFDDNSSPSVFSPTKTCNTCSGKGIISQITGLPPSGIEYQPLSKDSGDFRDNCEQFEDKWLKFGFLKCV